MAVRVHRCCVDHVGAVAHTLTQPMNTPPPTVLYPVGLRNAELVKQSKQEHSPMRQVEQYTNTDTMQPGVGQALHVDSDPSKTWGGVEQKGSAYTPGNTVAEGAWPNIDFYRDVAVQLQTTHLYGLYRAAPLLLGGVDCVCLIADIHNVCVLEHRYAGAA